jgi:tetratricopeptide (TPR) repeat protein
MAERQDEACPAAALAEALETLGQDEHGGLTQVELLSARYPRDARLHFLAGSVLAGQQRYADARQRMATAVELAPGYAVARFQLGLLDLSSGDAATAEEVWLPLQERGEEDALRLFAAGLRHLARDQFEEAIDLLRRGIARNEEHPLISRDMQMVIDEAEAKRAEAGASLEPEPTPLSATHMLLQQYATKSTKH